MGAGERQRRTSAGHTDAREPLTDAREPVGRGTVDRGKLMRAAGWKPAGGQDPPRVVVNHDPKATNDGHSVIIGYLDSTVPSSASTGRRAGKLVSRSRTSPAIAD